MQMTLFAPGIVADQARRTLAGTLVRYGVPGKTSAGLLRVRAGALQWPGDLGRVKLTREHDRTVVTGFMASLTDSPAEAAGAFKVAKTPDGDQALLEASPENRVRDGFSIEVDDAIIEGDEIVAARVIAVGQVTFPAFDDSRISSVAAAASDTPHGRKPSMDPNASSPAAAATPPPPTGVVTPAPVHGPAEPARPTDTPAPVTASAPAATPSVAASLAAVPSGVPAPTARATTSPRAGALAEFVGTIVAALSPGGGGGAAITAALSDVTYSAHSDNISAPAWSGELWSGVQYESVFTPLLSSGPLTNIRGNGWRWVTKPSIYDYTGNKAAVPSDVPATEPSDYTAARMAVGHDIDRAFYDFPDAGFLTGYAEAVREAWAVKLDAKVHDFIVANAVPLTVPDSGDPGTDPDPVTETSLFRAVGRGVLALKRARVGRATFVVVNDMDWFDLIDMTNLDLPAFLDLYGVAPREFVSSPDVDPGTVLIGAKQSATVRTLPGSPIRVDAQHLANGGIDNAFFGYWAIEQHHTGGIVSVPFA